MALFALSSIPCFLLLTSVSQGLTSVGHISQSPLLAGFGVLLAGGPGSKVVGDSKRGVSISLPSFLLQAASLVAAMWAL